MWPPWWLVTRSIPLVTTWEYHDDWWIHPCPCLQHIYVIMFCFHPFPWLPQWEYNDDWWLPPWTWLLLDIITIISDSIPALGYNMRILRFLLPLHISMWCEASLYYLLKFVRSRSNRRAIYRENDALLVLINHILISGNHWESLPLTNDGWLDGGWYGYETTPSIERVGCNHFGSFRI